LPNRRCYGEAEDSPEKRKIARWEEKRNESEVVKRQALMAELKRRRENREERPSAARQAAEKS
jgi:hypothetical protein